MGYRLTLFASYGALGAAATFLVSGAFLPFGHPGAPAALALAAVGLVGVNAGLTAKALTEQVARLEREVVGLTERLGGIPRDRPRRPTNGTPGVGPPAGSYQ